MTAVGAVGIPPEPPPLSKWTWALIILGLAGAIVLLVSMTGCASENTQLKIQTDAAFAASSSYRALDKAEEVRIAQIMEHGRSDKAAARVELEQHDLRYGVAKALIDELADLLERSSNGINAELAAQLLASTAKVAAAIAALKGGP